MAKDQTELLTELKNGSNSFSLIGKVKLVEGGFGGAVQKEKSNWLGVNSKFGVEISDGNVVYPAVRGGYMLDNPVLKKFGKEKGTGLVSIPYAKRHDENILSGLAQYVFMRGAISKDETGRPEVKKFIDAIDFEAYLAENLYDGMDVKVNGNVEYSPGKEDEVYRNYTVTSIYLNEEYKKNEEVTRLLVIMAVWLIFMAFTQARKFYTGMNFLTMAGQFPEYGLMALGGMLCMITGGIDLSVVGTANMASILTVFTLTRLFGADGTMPLAFSVVIFLIAIVTGIVVGSLNAFLISKLGVPPILATLGVNELLTGLCVVMTNGSAISSFPKQYCDFFSGNLFGFIPRRLLVFIVVAIIIWFMLEHCTYGTKLRLYGTNAHVAKFSGINTTSLLFRTHITSSICAALGGLMMLATYSSARADYGTNYTMQSILLVVLGGVSPNGGKGKISGVITAIVLLKMIESGINRFRSVSTYYVTLIWGAVLILALVIDYVSQKPKHAK